MKLVTGGRKIKAQAVQKISACLAVVTVFGLLATAQAKADELIANGGFEGGTYSVTQNSSTNNSVPVDWTPNSAFVESTANGGPSGAYEIAPYSGNYSLMLAGADGAPMPALSQSFSDSVGATYSGVFYLYETADYDPNAIFTATLDGNTILSLNNTGDAYIEETFSFTGTGDDTLTFAGESNAGQWHVDDVSISGSAATAVPEPPSVLLFLAGLAVIGSALYFGRNKALTA